MHLFYVLALLVLGFGLGRLRHPANLKLSKIKAEVEFYEHSVGVEVQTLVANIKRYL
jgi:hypothetical protein